MKKKFINDTMGFFIMLFLSIAPLFLLFFSLRFAYTAPNPLALRITSSILYGLLTLACLTCIILRTEIIVISSCRIVCYNLSKRPVVVHISEISEICESTKIIYGIDNYRNPVWQITDSSGRSISIAQTKRRESIIDFIRMQSGIE